MKKETNVTFYQIKDMMTLWFKIKIADLSGKRYNIFFFFFLRNKNDNCAYIALMDILITLDYKLYFTGSSFYEITDPLV